MVGRLDELLAQLTCPAKPAGSVRHAPAPRASFVSMRLHFALWAAPLAWACTPPGDASERSAPPRAIAAPGARTIIDSILPPAEEMRRFRVSGGPVRRALSGGESTREALVRSFLRALQTHDTATIRSLVLDRVEFADLYYPASRFSRAPYRTPVGLLWTRIQMNSEKGIVRATRRLAGQPTALIGVRCASPPETVGRSQLHDRCVTRYRTAAGDTASIRLFGSIIETAGRVKFFSYANDM